MNSTSVQQAAAVVAALGVLLLLVPVPRVATWARRGTGALLVVAGWAAVALTLLPSGEADRLRDRLTSPLGAAAAVVAVAVLLVAAWLGARLVLARPTWWFVALALALPVRIPVPVGGSDRNLLLPLYVVIAFGVLASVLARVGDPARRADDPRTPLDVPVALFTAFSLASIAWSVDVGEGAVKAVFFYVPFLLLFATVVDHWPRARALAALTATTLALSVPVAVLAVGQYLARDVFLNERLQQSNVYSRFFRANAIFYDPNILGRFLAVALAACVAVAWLRRTRARELAGLAAVAVVLSAGLAVTFSRSSCLMLITALAIMAWWAFGGRRTLAVGGAVLALMAAGALVASPNVRDAVVSTHRLQKVSEGRFDLMKGGVEIWRESPVHGAGLGGFERRYQQTLTPAEQRRIRVIISHNTPVTVLSELGIAGFALFLVLLVVAWRALARGARATGGASGWAQWTMLAVLTGIAVHSLLYSALFEDPYTWVLVAAAPALALRRPAPVAPPRPAPSAATPVAAG